MCFKTKSKYKNKNGTVYLKGDQVVITKEEWSSLLEVLNNPPAPNTELKNLMKGKK